MEKYCIGIPCGILLWAFVIWFFRCLKTGSWPQILGVDYPQNPIETNDPVDAMNIVYQRSTSRNTGDKVILTVDTKVPSCYGYDRAIRWLNEDGDPRQFEIKYE